MTDRIKVAISSDFLTAFARLPRQVQGKVTEFVNKFRNNPKASGINYEKLNMGIDKKICSVRIDDTYRGIVVRQQETGVYLLLWVDHHDEAYQWASKKRCEVNSKTGAIQVYDVRTVVEKISVPEKVSLFAGAKDEELLKLGVPEAQLEFVRSFISKEDFYQAESAMPHDAYEHLSWLAEGFELWRNPWKNGAFSFIPHKGRLCRESIPVRQEFSAAQALARPLSLCIEQNIWHQNVKVSREF